MRVWVGGIIGTLYLLFSPVTHILCVLLMAEKIGMLYSGELDFFVYIVFTRVNKVGDKTGAFCSILIILVL